jgi:hypothetical protein
MDSAYTGTFCDVNDGGVKYIRADLVTPSDTATKAALDCNGTPESIALNKILSALDVYDLNINSRGLFEGYIRAAMSKPQVDEGGE